jgi:hypothetical protein
MSSRFEIVNELTVETILNLVPSGLPLPTKLVAALMVSGFTVLVAQRLAVSIVARRLVCKLSPRQVQ